MRYRNIILFILPIIISLSLHYPILNSDLIGIHVWRQTQTQTVIYNLTNNDGTIFHPNRFDISTGTREILYEFPIYQLSVSLVNKIFGYEVLHSRMFSFTLFIVFLFYFLKLITRFTSLRVGLLTNFCLCFSPLLFYYCVNPLPDMLALTFSIIGLYYFFVFKTISEFKYIVLASIFFMLSTLCKLPFILIGTPLLVDFLKNLKNKKVVLYYITCLPIFIPVVIWYMYSIPTWVGNNVTHGLIKNNKTLLELFDIATFHFISTLPELITNYASLFFLIVGTFLFFKNKMYKYHFYTISCLISLLLYFFFEINMIGKTHDYYLLPFVIPVFLVVGYGISSLLKIKKYNKVVYALVLITPLTAWLRINTRWEKDNVGFNKDYYEKSIAIKQILDTNAFCIIDSDESKFISLYYLKRNGYCFYENEINEEKLNKALKHENSFLITENLKFDTSLYKSIKFKKVFSNNLIIYKVNK